MSSDVEEIACRSATEIAYAYRAGETDPVALTECLLARIERAKGDRIFIAVTAQSALAEARAAAARYRDGRPLSLLDGVPTAWKDLFDVAGTTTTSGSALHRDNEPAVKDAPAVARTRAAGMVSLGKLNLTEFAYSGLGLNPHFGTPVNPNDRRVHRSPGGSSSGSGAAVAAGLVPCAIGTDTGGSVRVPAALNGIVGFKTTEGRIDKRGVRALSPTLDTIGPLARSVMDCALVDMVIRGAVTLDARRTDIEGLCFVIPQNVVFDDAEPAVVANFEKSIAILEKAGARISRRRLALLDDIAAATAAHGSLTAAEAYNEHRRIIDSDQVDRIDRRVVRRILQGKAMSANDLLSLQRVRRQAIDDLARELDGGYLAMPTTAITAPAIAPLEADDELFSTVNLRMLRNTMAGNILKTCGLALPNGHDENDLPTSILISGVAGDDDRLLGHGLEIERLLAGTHRPVWRGAWGQR